jgi:hypothetical protein
MPSGHVNEEYKAGLAVWVARERSARVRRIPSGQGWGQAQGQAQGQDQGWGGCD